MIGTPIDNIYLSCVKMYTKNMIKIYTSPSCSSCRKVKKWFEEQQIPYVEKNIFSSVLSESELRDILAKSENGTDDIIATKSKIIKEGNVDIESMTIKELIEFIRKNPSVLKRPIMVDDTQIQVGYNDDDITVFIPKARRMINESCLECGCSYYELCEQARKAKKN